MDDINIKRQVINMTKSWKGVSSIHKETLMALIGLFSEISYKNSDNEIVPVKCIYGGRERAIAKINQEDNLVLPLISIIPKARELVDDRRKYSPVLKVQSMWSHSKQRAIRVVSLPPRPVNMVYEVNIWGKYVENVNQVLEQSRRFFNPSHTLHTPTNSQTQAFLESEDDASTKIPGDGEDRTIVKKLTISVETYVPSPLFTITSSGKIEELDVNIEIRKG